MQNTLTTYEKEMIESLESIMESPLFNGEERIEKIKETFLKIKNHQNK